MDPDFAAALDELEREPTPEELDAAEKQRNQIESLRVRYEELGMANLEESCFANRPNLHEAYMAGWMASFQCNARMPTKDEIALAAQYEDKDERGRLDAIAVLEEMLGWRS